MSVIVKCKSCNGTGYIPMGNGVRGLLVCKACNGVGKYENDEITIINDEYYYKIPNGTSYVYETIPKEFKPYFDKLQQENKQLKEKVGELTQSLNEQMKETNKENLDCSKYAIENQQLKDKIKQLEKCYCNRSDCSGRIKDSRKYDSVVQQLDKYKEVIEEAREYIKDSCYYPELENYSNMTSEEVKELLQILDKAKENK